MTSFQIKLLATLLMVCDHIGIVFFPNQLIFRWIGRLSFPIFAWLLGKGEKYTKDFSSYLFRLTVCSVLSQPIYYLLFNNYNLNILITLLLGLLAIRLGKLININKKGRENLFSDLVTNNNYESTNKVGVQRLTLSAFFTSKYLIWFTFALIAESVNADYGAYGVITVAILSEFNSTSLKWWLKWLIVNSLVLIIPGFKSYQLLALFAPFIILLWNGNQGKKVKLFYLFYPLHLMLLKALELMSGVVARI